MYLNRIYNLQSYKQQLLTFLQKHKPFFIYEGEKYYIQDIASYHIHAGDYFLKYKPSGGHSNYGGNQLNYFDLELLKKDASGIKDMILRNPRLNHQEKASSIYPETWSEFTCDLKAIEIMVNNTANINIDIIKGIINFEGYSSDGFKIKIGYDIKFKKIKTHYPYFN